MAARIATDQIIDLRTTLRYLGVPIESSTYMFGDNESVITSSTIPYLSLSKRHNALSYHRVREAVAAGIIKFYHIKGQDNPADILSKHCGHPQMWPHVRPLLFYGGETSDIPDDVKPSQRKENSGVVKTGPSFTNEPGEPIGNGTEKEDSADQRASQKLAMA